MKNIKATHFFLTTASFAALLLVSSCKESPVVGPAVNSLTGMPIENEQRLSTAASVAIANGKTQEALALYEKLYDQNRHDAENLLNYAQLLRKTGKGQEALDLLEPLAKGSRRFRPPPALRYMIMNEYAAALVETGHFEKAEKMVEKILSDPKAAAYYSDAEQLQGIILDAQGNHKEAEKAFRAALDHWKGDKTAVMNNLALNLANQGMFDESLSILREALVMSPKKEYIAQNIEMVSDLRKAVMPKAPVDIKK